MASSVVEIYNLALLRVGHSRRINDPDETSNEAQLCNDLYDQCLDFVLEDYPWRFAKKRITLAPKTGTPPSVWAYQYAKPSGLLKARYIVQPGFRNTLLQDKVPFEMACDTDDTDVIYTDMPEAELVYTARITDVARFPPSFVSALSYYLASELALPLRGDRGASVAQMMQSAYAQVVRLAAASSLNQGFDQSPTNEFDEARNA